MSDIPGFAKWSSVVDPVDVFAYLESVYKSFDSILNRHHNVSNFHMIGDCFVAIAGLNKPQITDHATIMVQFAIDILNNLSLEVAHCLKQQSLSPIPDDLAVRIGIHSGPTIAGILHGSIPRFKLIGDTLNTGTCNKSLELNQGRMYCHQFNLFILLNLLFLSIAFLLKNTGEADRIHCSHETATLLRIKEKGSVLLEREDRIKFEGKGEDEFCWVMVLVFV